MKHISRLSGRWGSLDAYDDDGNYGIIDATGYGGIAGGTASFAAYGQFTSADTIFDLAGKSINVGGSAGAILGDVTLEGVISKGYKGVNLGVAIGWTTPVELHAILDDAKVDVKGNIFDDVKGLFDDIRDITEKIGEFFSGNSDANDSSSSGTGVGGVSGADLGKGSDEW